ncbi:uncharacterized protein LOC128230217 isoform X1 [Mya arenaria]|uniref:uncharacterized protein LOC128230217 isoform X1 n=1 Tax=Mya arenaria TaxID=6604 RepID=UPI0022E1BE7D|nr:uncharacterized protein LOC128230217 isoform X1 [Mya arenaria]XP_052798263.1 uncharacterized protein LOC128230217 isoform X1 [Mya arenaria]
MNRGRKFGDVKRMTVNGGSGVEEDTTFSNLAQFNGPETALDIDPGAENTCTNFANTEIYRQLRPLLICMRLFGLFFRRTIDTKGRPYMEPVVMYCFIVNFLNVLNAIRSFTVYSSSDEFDSVMVQKLLFTIWSSECTFKGLLLMWNCYKQDGLPKFFLEWDAVCGNVKLSKVCMFMMKKYIFLSFIFIGVNSIVFTLTLIYVPMLETIYLEVVWKNALEFKNNLHFKMILTFLAVLNSSSSMFPMSLFIVLSFAIGRRLKKYTDELVLAMSFEGFNEKLEDFRIRHQNLCKIVHILDSIFAPMLAAVYIANIPMFCLVLYTMVTTLDLHLSILLINLFWLSFILLQMTLVSITAAWVNVQAHSPLEHIYTIRFSRSSNDTQLQMFMFLNRLTGTQVGLSAMKLFVVDKPTILTIAGMMITYFVLLIEFKMPADTNCACHVNGTIVMDNSTLLISHVSYT